MSTCDSDQEDTLRRLVTNIAYMTKMKKEQIPDFVMKLLKYKHRQVNCGAFKSVYVYDDIAVSVELIRDEDVDKETQKKFEVLRNIVKQNDEIKNHVIIPEETWEYETGPLGMNYRFEKLSLCPYGDLSSESNIEIGDIQFEKLMRTLQILHNNGIILMDIKPQNIMICACKCLAFIDLDGIINLQDGNHFWEERIYIYDGIQYSGTAVLIDYWKGGLTYFWNFLAGSRGIPPFYVEMQNEDMKINTPRKYKSGIPGPFLKLADWNALALTIIFRRFMRFEKSKDKWGFFYTLKNFEQMVLYDTIDIPEQVLQNDPLLKNSYKVVVGTAKCIRNFINTGGYYIKEVMKAANNTIDYTIINDFANNFETGIYNSQQGSELNLPSYDKPTEIRKEYIKVNTKVNNERKLKQDQLKHRRKNAEKILKKDEERKKRRAFYRKLNPFKRRRTQKLMLEDLKF